MSNSSSELKFEPGFVVHTTEKGEKVVLQLDLGGGIWIAKAHINAIKEQDLNARTMSKSMFERLRDNIKNHGGLESLPYCAITYDGKSDIIKGVEVVSGHHRVRGCRAAEIFEIHILLDVKHLSRDEIIARQLAHNSISGVDDKDMLTRLFKSIEDIDLRLETYIDQEQLGIEIDGTTPIVDVDLDVQFYNVGLIFLPSQFDRFDKLVDRLKGDEKGVYLIDKELFPKFKEAVQAVQDVYQIKSISMAIAKMVEICNEALPKEDDEEEKKKEEEVAKV